MARKRKTSNPFRNDSADYEVGYGKPPEDGKIKPGERRNPKGRPKGARNKPKPSTDFAKMVLAEGIRPVPVTEQGRKKSLPLNTGVVRRLAGNAAKGDPHAVREHLRLQQAADRELRAQQRADFQSAVDYKIKMSAELRNRDEQGMPPPRNLYPHPDDIIPDFVNNTYTIAGPLNAHQDRVLNLLVQTLHLDEYEHLVCLQDLAADPRGPHAEFLIKEAAYYLMRIQKWREYLGVPWTTRAPPTPDWQALAPPKKKPDPKS